MLDEIDPDTNCLENVCHCVYIDEKDLDSFVPQNSNNKLNILHINSRSIKKNFSGIIALLNSTTVKFTLIAITETWLSVSNEDFFQIDGYIFVPVSRTTKKSGGVAMFIDNTIDYKLLSDVSSIKDSIESLFVEISVNRTDCMIIGCIYRPPNSDIGEFFNEMTILLNYPVIAKAKYSAVLGDFNIDLLDSLKSATRTFLNMMHAHFYSPTIDKPTRVTETSATLIDNFFVNNLKIDRSTGILYSDISDHYPIILKLDLNITKNRPPKFVSKRIFNTKNTADFIRSLSQINWLEIQQSISEKRLPHIGYTMFSDIFVSKFEEHFPKVKMKLNTRNSPRKEWITTALIKCCKKKSALYKIFKQKPTAQHKQKYLKYSKILKKLLAAQEKKYYEIKFESYNGDMARTWKTINSLIRKKEPIINTICFETSNGVINDNKKIANSFNTFFATVGEQLATKIPKSNVNMELFLTGTYPDSFLILPTTPQEIEKIVANLNSKTSFGHDEVPLTILKNCIRPISGILSYLINDSFQNGFFPNELKIAKVCPIYKNGPKNILSNYRPISILPSISKIYEKAMQVRLTKYLISRNILSKNQYGFREKHSPYMALLDMCDNVTKNMDAGNFSLAIFIDLQKAFDSLDHKLLLNKLAHYGIRGVALEWFSSYLSQRKQYVSYENSLSDMELVKWGIPQGSILGPLLFIIFINDISNTTKLLHFILFADDTNIFCTGDSIDKVYEIANRELPKLEVWFHTNKLTLNLKKTTYILFGKKLKNKCSHKLFLNGQEIKRQKSTKFLGVHIDENLDWKSHIANLVSKVSKSIGILYRVRNVLNHCTLKMLYLSLIQPYLLYCIVIWGSAYANALNPLIVLQKRAIRVINYASFAAHSTPLFKKCNLLALSEIYSRETSIYVYKCLNNLLPVDILGYIEYNTVYSLHNTRLRDQLLLVVPMNRTVKRDKFVSFIGPTVWNALPLGIRLCSSLAIFKCRTMEFYSRNY